MATRATYTLVNNEYHEKRKLDVYIHWDGYEEGALHYYLNAIRESEKVQEDSSIKRTIVKGGFIESFIYANISNAEITNKDQHSDTEFHYEMSFEKIKIFTKKWDDEKFSFSEILTPLEFLNKYGDEEEKEDFIYLDNKLLTKKSIKDRINTRMEELYKFAAIDAIGNASSIASDLYKKIEKIQSFKDPYFRDIIYYKSDIEKITKKFISINWNISSAVSFELIDKKLDQEEKEKEFYKLSNYDKNKCKEDALKSYINRIYKEN